MKHYEIMFILSPVLTEEDKNKLIDQIKQIFTSKNQASIEKVDEWGSRNLAYEINHFKRGYYVILYVAVETNVAIEEFNRYVTTNEKVIRYIVIKK
jgi:small subunit ribosomal protein S6